MPLAKRIVALMPPHLVYCEPYFGGGAVLLAKDPNGVSEVANDLNSNLMNFWQCLADPDAFAAFVRRADAMPFSESLWKASQERLQTPCDAAEKPCVACGLAFFVCCRQSLAGRMKNFAPLSRTRTRGGMNEQASAWLTAVDGLPEVHARMRRVAILNRDALDVMRQQDGKDSLIYADCPYLHETRASTGEYLHEMSEGDHRKMLGVLLTLESKVILSGYPSAMYEQELDGWRVVDFDMANAAAGGATKRRMTERCWLNFNEEGRPQGRREKP